MNKYQTYLKEKQTNQLLHKSFHYIKNVIKINKTNSLTHELAKAATCIEIHKNGSDFYTEAILLNGKRCDIIDITNQSIIEIVHTETKKKQEQKKKDYPLPIIFLNAKKVLKPLISDNQNI